MYIHIPNLYTYPCVQLTSLTCQFSICRLASAYFWFHPHVLPSLLSIINSELEGMKYQWYGPVLGFIVYVYVCVYVLQVGA